MAFKLLDIILIGIMVISGLLALMRGFTREVLSLVAWGAAAVAAYFAIRSPELIAYVRQYQFLEQEIVAQIAVGATVFLIVLIVVSVISVKLSDAVVDSAAGAFDRTLGFIYGLARGLVLVTIAYIFYGFFVDPPRQETWITQAWSRPFIENVKSIILSVIPPDIAESLRAMDITKDQSGGTTSVTVQPESDEPGAATEEEGYKRNDSQSMDQLIQGTQGQQPSGGAPEQPQQPSGGTTEQPSFGGQSNPN